MISESIFQYITNPFIFNSAIAKVAVTSSEMHYKRVNIIYN